MEEQSNVTPPTCTVHDTPKKWIKPGTSKKTGNAYDGFFVCDSCSDERKAQKTGGNNDEVLDALRRVYAKLTDIEKKIDDVKELPIVNIG